MQLYTHTQGFFINQKNSQINKENFEDILLNAHD